MSEKSNAYLWLFFCVVCVHACFAQSLASADQIPVWKTINIGTFRSVINLREALEASECGLATSNNSPNLTRSATISCKLGDSANEILGRPECELAERREKLSWFSYLGRTSVFGRIVSRHSVKSTSAQKVWVLLYARLKSVRS